MPRQNRIRAIHLTLARPLAILCAMRRVPGTTAASRSDVPTRRDLLLEILALRHQLAVLARSNRRFRTSDRLLWLMLRRVWPRWRDAFPKGLSNQFVWRGRLFYPAQLAGSRFASREPHASRRLSYIIGLSPSRAPSVGTHFHCRSIDGHRHRHLDDRNLCQGTAHSSC